MKRRVLMWMTIVCILVVGISVTRLTRDFVSADAKAMAEGAAVQAAVTALAPETQSALPAETKVQDSLQAKTQSDAAMPRALENSETYDTGSTKPPLDTTKMENTQETVKSPLDPVIQEKAEDGAEEETTSYNAEMLFERFAQAEENAQKVWENVSSDNRAAYLAAAEQERVIWDYELNQVYSLIRGKMTQEEAETLKILEVEWIKERDLYAEKAAAKNSAKNAYNQNPGYTKALAEKTKERCYWLVSEYEDILNRDMPSGE